MCKRPLIFTFLAVILFTNLAAEFVTLKGSNGQEADFEIESITSEGIKATPKNGYRKIFLKWEQLDVDWLKQNQATIWKEKKAAEAALVAAYGRFHFGQTQAEVIRIIKTSGGMKVPGEPFNEQNPEALWVTLNSSTLRQFFRFVFDKDKGLIELQMHHNFPADESITEELETQWEQVIQMVAAYNCSLTEEKLFPRESSWRRLENEKESDQPAGILTHRWEDDRRMLELALVSKQILIGKKVVKSSQTSLMGSTSRASYPTEDKTNWLVFKAQLK